MYWMDRAERNLLSVCRSDWTEPRPGFTIRSPARPNPITLSLAEVVTVRGGIITVKGIDALDGSPVIDIKPYVRDLDCVQDQKD